MDRRNIIVDSVEQVDQEGNERQRDSDVVVRVDHDGDEAKPFDVYVDIPNWPRVGHNTIVRCDGRALVQAVLAAIAKAGA